MRDEDSPRGGDFGTFPLPLKAGLPYLGSSSASYGAAETGFLFLEIFLSKGFATKFLCSFSACQICLQE